MSLEVRQETLEMADEEDDPFVSIIDQCKYSSSQEDLLRYCLFCRESQEGLLAFSSQESSLPGDLEAASQALIISSPPETQPEEEEEELQGASQGLIISSPPETQPQEEEKEEELPVASQGLVICSAPDTQPEESQGLVSAADTQPEEESQGLVSAADTQPEEDFQTPEERLHLASSEEQWMDLDEQVDSKIDGDTDVLDASLDLDETVDLGNDSYVNFSEENSVAGNDSQMLKAALVDDDDSGDNSAPLVGKSPEGKVPIEILPFQESLGLPEPMEEGLGLSEPMNEGLEQPPVSEGLGLPEPMNEGLEPPLVSEGLGLPEPMNEGLELLEPMNESLGIPEPMNGGLLPSEPMGDDLDDTSSKNLITSEMNAQLLVTDTVDSSVGRSREICLGSVVEETIESPAAKNLESLKSRCNTPSMSSPKSPQRSQNTATYENFDEVTCHSDLFFEKGDMLVVHPVTNEVQVLKIAARNNSGVVMCFMDAVMEDATPIAIEKGLAPEISTERDLDLDIPQTGVVHNDEGKRGSHNMEGLGEVRKAGSIDISPVSEDPLGLRKLPNWVGGKDNAMRSLRQSGKRRVGGADCLNHSGINKVGEVEGSGSGGARLGEVDGMGCDAGRVDEIDTGRRLGEGVGLGHRGKRTAEDAGYSSIATEVLSSGKEYEDMMNLLAATFVREINQNTGSGRGRGRVEKVGGSGNPGRKMRDGKVSGSHGKDTARVKEAGNGGGRVEGSGNAGRKIREGKGSGSHGNETGNGGGRVEEVDGSGNAGRRSGEGKGSASHGKTTGNSEGSSRVTSSGNQSQAMKNLLTASFLRETNAIKEKADNSNESSQTSEDILEVAIQAGLKFPRPRWWKPQGYETNRDN